MAHKKFRDFPMIWEALENLGIDNGWSPSPFAIVPRWWLERVEKADAELSKMSPEQRGTLAMGEETEVDDLVTSFGAQTAKEVLDAAFDDGELTFVQQVHTTAVQHVAYENEVARKRRDK